MNDLERLLAIEEIRQLKARYFRAIDTNDEQLLRSVFADDATADWRDAAADPKTGFSALPAGEDNHGDDVVKVLHGGDVVTKAIVASAWPLVSVHQGHMPEIEILSDSSATGIWSMTDVCRMPVGYRVLSGNPLRTQVLTAPATLYGWGRYHETYERIGGKWKIKSSRLVRYRLESVKDPEQG